MNGQQPRRSFQALGVLPLRPLVSALLLPMVLGCGSDRPNPTEPGVTVSAVSLPVAGAVYRGAEAHVFMGGQVQMFCGTHGVFSNAVDPPRTVGATVLSEYSATFVGELTLAPPAVPSSETYSLNLQAQMAESITLTSDSGTRQTFDTELVRFELQGTGMPTGVMVRESPAVASAGATTVTSVSGGQLRVEAYYDVWLDVSLDGGRSWSPADGAVRMTLEPS